MASSSPQSTPTERRKLDDGAERGSRGGAESSRRWTAVAGSTPSVGSPLQGSAWQTWVGDRIMAMTSLLQSDQIWEEGGEVMRLVGRVAFSYVQ